MVAVDLGQWRRTLIEGWPEEVSSEEEELEVSSLPGYTSAAGAEFGPLYGEDEDLAKAIALSLAEQDVVQTSGHRNESAFTRCWHINQKAGKLSIQRVMD